MKNKSALMILTLTGLMIFARAGNYIRELVEPKTFKKPEGLKNWNGSETLNTSKFL